jgi:hypothetical protein
MADTDELHEVPDRRRRFPLSRQCRAGLSRPWLLANALCQPVGSALP